MDIAHPVVKTLHELVGLAAPAIPPDDTTRVDAETTVYVVEGRPVKFKRASPATPETPTTTW